MFRRRQSLGWFGRPKAPPLLRQANRLLKNKKYPEAAEAFEQLAEAAHAVEGPRAPMFFLQAGRARFLNDQPNLGLEHVKQGLQIFADRGDLHRIRRAAVRVIAELNEYNRNAEAIKIRDFMNNLLPAGIKQLHEDYHAGGKRPRLPTHCPSCSAVINPEDTEWFDEMTAECSYCGSPVRGK
jgi:hypothetical protein